jgi:Zn-dependent protease with chaperone function
VLINIINSKIVFDKHYRNTNENELIKITKFFQIAQNNSLISSSFIKKICVKITKKNNKYVPIGTCNTLNTIGLSSYIIENYDEKILFGILAHELGHVYYKHKLHLFVYAISTSIRLYSIFLLTIFFSYNCKHFYGVILNSFFAGSILYFTYYNISKLQAPFFVAPFLFILRKQENEADCFTKKIGFGAGLIMLFKLIDDDKKIDWFDTHPTTLKRIMNIKD